MKKFTILGSFIVTALLALTSCEGLTFNSGEDLINELTGYANVQITRTVGEGTETDSMKFSNSICDVFDFKSVDSTLSAGYSTIGIGANVDLSVSNVELSFPFMYYRLNDSTTGAYNFDTILSMTMLQNFNYESLMDILGNPQGGNMVMIAENDSCWYITYEGQLVVTEFPSIGHLFKCDLNGAKALYVTQAKIDELTSDIENMNYTHMTEPDYYFPSVTLSGNITSRRWALIHNVFNTAFRQ